MNFWEWAGLVFIIGIIVCGCVSAICEAWVKVEQEKTKQKELDNKFKFITNDILQRLEEKRGE